MTEPTVLTLQVSPRTPSSEQLVRGLNANPKNLMRLMSTEHVGRLHEYLTKKWKISEFDLVLTCRGTRMSLTDSLGAYMETSVSSKIPIEYDFVSPDEVSTATESSTRASSPLPSSQVDSILHEIQAMNNNFELKPIVKAVTQAAEAEPQHGEKRKGIPEERTDTIIREPACASSSVSEVEAVDRCHTTGIDVRLPDTVHLAMTAYEPSGKHMVANDLSLMDSLYKDVLDRQKDMFLSVLDSQAKWMAQMQTQMINTCLAVQEKALLMAIHGRSSDEVEDTPRIDGKKLRKSKN